MSLRAAILGTGTMGTALARALARGGVALTIGSRDGVRATSLAEELRALGAHAHGGDYAGAAGSADLVILAVGYEHARQTLEASGHALGGKIVVDPTTPWGADVPNTSGAEELARLLPASAVLVGAWKTTYASELDAARPGEGHDTFVCGDQPSAKVRVAELVRATGFRAVDVGPLAEARVLEGMCRMMGPTLKAIGASPGAFPAWRFVP